MVKYYEVTKSQHAKDIEHLVAFNNNGIWIKEPILNGSSFRIKLGTNSVVNIKGLKTETLTFLKNSISSKRLRITPKQKITKLKIKNDLKKLDKIYLIIILFINSIRF